MPLGPGHGQDADGGPECDAGKDRPPQEGALSAGPLARELATTSSQFITQHARNMASFRAIGTMDAVDSLPTWVRWIIVVAVGLSPILTYFIVVVVGRFLRRRLWPPPQGSSVVAHQPGETPKRFRNLARLA